MPDKKADKNINLTSRKVKDDSLKPLLQELSELIKGKISIKLKLNN